MPSNVTTRERVLASINHREPDRVPVDLGATPSSGISTIAYYNLKNYLGITEGHTRVYDVVQQLAQPEEFILDRFGIDAVDVGRTFNTQDEDWYDIALPPGPATGGQTITVQFPAWFRPVPREDGSWDAYSSDGTRVAMMPSGATFFDGTCHPYLDGYPADYRDLPAAMGKIHWSALVHSPWDSAGQPDFWERVHGPDAALLRALIEGNLADQATAIRQKYREAITICSTIPSITGF